MTTSMRRALRAVAVLTVLGCSGDKGSGPAPTISVTATPSTLTLQQGTSGTVTVALTRGGGFAAAVNVSVSGLPSGVGVSVAPAQLTGAVTSATVTVTVDATVAAGTYTATIHAAAAGVGEATTTYTLTVTAIPNYSLTATPPAVTIPQAGTGTTTIGVVRTNFAGAVALTLDSPPTGITGAFNPASATGDQSVLTLSVDQAVATGNYNVTVKGSATGPGDKTTTVTLTVVQPNYTLSATPAAVTIPAGLSATTTIGIARTNFTGGVALTLDNPPAGITGAFNPTPATGDNSVLTISVAPTVAAADYTLTVKGSATGPGDKVTQVALTVTQQPDYALSATPNTLTITAGTNQTTTVNITRANFTGAVTLALDAPPAGITATFNPTAPTGTSSIATIDVAASVVAGNYPLTIKGTATGVPTDVDPGAASLAVGDRTTTVTVTVVPVPTFVIDAEPPAISIQQGSTGNTTVDIARTNFTGDIAFSLVSPPTGITGVFTPATSTGTGTSTALVISVDGSVATGVYPLTIQGASTGPGNKTATLTVTVVSGPTVVLNASPAVLSIEQGASGTSSLGATRTNYPGNIVPSSTGQPAGMTVTFNPNPMTGNTSTITVAVGGGVAVGQYNLTITGASGVAGNPTTPLQVNVTAPSGSSVVWDFCNTDDVPIKFWRKSNGSWAEVPATVVGNVTRFSFTISGATGGVAFTIATDAAVRTILPRRQTALKKLVRRTIQQAQAARSKARKRGARIRTTDYSTSLFLATTAEIQSSADVCIVDPTPVLKHFTTTGQASTEEGLLGYGGNPMGLASTTNAYDVNVVQGAGTYDWLAMFGPTPGLPDLEHDWQQYKIGRGDVAPGSTVNIDRATTTAMVSFPVTVTGGNGGSMWSLYEGMTGARGAITASQIGPLLNTTGQGNMFFVQPGDRLSTDLVSLQFTNLESLPNVDNFISSINYLGSAPPGSGNFTLNQGIPAFVVTPVSGAAVPTWSVSGNTPTDYQGAAGGPIIAAFIGAGAANEYSVTATRAWLNANSFTTTYTLAGEDLPGFDPLWAAVGPLDSSAITMFSSNFTSGAVAGSVVKLALRSQTP